MLTAISRGDPTTVLAALTWRWGDKSRDAWTLITLGGALAALAEQRESERAA